MTQLFVLAGLLIVAPESNPLPDGAVRRLGPLRFRHTADVQHLAFSPDDRYLATVAAGESVRVWDARTGTLVRQLGPSPARARNFVAFADARTVVAVLADATLVRLDVPTGRRTLAVKLTDDPNWKEYWISADGNRVRVADWKETRQFDATTGRPVDAADRAPAKFSEVAARSGTLLASVAPGGRVLVRPTRNGVLAPPPPTGAVLHLHLTDHGRTAAGWATGEDLLGRGRFVGWDVRTGAAVPLPAGSDRSRLAPVASPDGRWVAVGTADNGLEVIDRRTGERVAGLADLGYQTVRAGWFAGPARLLVGGGRFRDDPVLAVDWAADAPRVDAVGPADGPRGGRLLDVSADGRRMVADDTGGLPTGVIDTTTGAAVGKFGMFGADRVSAATLSPDGRRVAVFDLYDRLTVWDVDAGTRRPGFLRPGRSPWAATGGRPTPAAAFNPAGTLLATSAADGVAALWDADTGEAVGEFRPPDGVRGLAFTPDGRHLLSAGGQGPITVWDVYRLETPPPAAATAAELAKAWAALVGGGPAGHAAVRTLAGSPAAAVGLLRDRLPTAVAPPAADVDRWLAALDSPRFADREAAAAALARAAAVIGPRLRKELAATASAEVRARLEKLLADDSGATREKRAVEVLVVIGTAEARALLAGYAAGPADARLTRAAKAALGRVGGQVR